MDAVRAWIRLLVFACLLAPLGCSDDAPRSTPSARPAGVGAPAAKAPEAGRSVPPSRLGDTAGEPVPSLEEAAEITRLYGEVLQRTPTDRDWLYGTSRLPDSKLRIRGALFRMLGSVADPNDKDFLKAAVVRLAYFQDDIDDATPLSASAPDGRTYQEIVEAEVSALTFEVARRGYGTIPE